MEDAKCQSSVWYSLDMLTSKNDQMKKMSNVNFQTFWKHNIFDSIQNDVNVKKTDHMAALLHKSCFTDQEKQHGRVGGYGSQ